MRILIIVPLFFLMSFQAIAQSSFEVFGGYGYENESTIEGNPFTNRTTSTLILSLVDSIAFQSVVDRTLVNSYDIKPLSAVQFGFNQFFHFGEDLEIGFGVHALFKTFTFTSNMKELNATVISQDTVTLGSILFPNFQSSCDQIISEGPDFFDFKPKETVGYLRIPLNIRYQLPEIEKTSVEFNAFLQTPILFRIHHLNSEFTREVENGLNICRSIRTQETLKNTDSFNPLVFGIGGGVNYEVLKNVFVSLKANKILTSLINEKEGDEGFFQFSADEIRNVKYKPLVFTAGVSYRFGKSGKTEK